ncbi:His-Xaa-Ser system radical SAM maturase HxsB [Myroides odoratimimus]|nr:His-Xaa-Ser system radical SAM maturase HxsB [Myroides odoratimimus]
MLNNKPKTNRKFKGIDIYDNNHNKSYYLLPFKFHRDSYGDEVLVNEVGDYLICENGTVEKIIKRDIKVGSKLYIDLLSNYFISEELIPPYIDIYATRYRTKKLFLNYFTGLHIFVVSLRCEHTCKYCQVSRVTQNKDAFDISFETLDKGIDLMFRSPNPHLTMEFQGGEALLAFDKIKYGVLKALKLSELVNKKITFVICTNLAIIDDEILEFCKEYNILISTSLDGPKVVHDTNRHKPHASSYDLTIKGIKKSREILGHDNVSALMTTTNHSLKFPIEIIDEYITQGFKGIFLRNISPYGFALKSKISQYETESFLDFYKIGLKYIIDYNLKGNFFVEDLAKIFLTKMLTPFGVGYVDLQSPAGLVTGVIVYNYNGEIYATDESRMLAEQKDFTFRLGDVNNSYEEIFFGDKVQKITEVWANESLTGCSECAFQQYCGADPVHNHATQGDMYGYRPDSDFCKKNMSIIEHLFELMKDDKVKRIFESWVN